MRFFLAVLIAAAAGAAAGAENEILLPSTDGGTVTVKGTSLVRDDAGGVAGAGRTEVSDPLLSLVCVGAVAIRTSEGYFSSLDASGTVEARTGEKTIRGGRLEYEATRHLVIASGDPSLAEKGTTYRADKRILCYLETGVVRCEPKALITIDKGVEREMKKAKGGRKFLGLF